MTAAVVYPFRTASLFAHLTLGFAGLCLSVAETPFIPEMQFAPAIYVFFVGLAWKQAGRWTLTTRTANALGLLIALGVVGWITWRVQSADVTMWIRDVPVPVAVVPYLGPMLMALLVVRLFQRRKAGDFWQLQSLGLLQVALGCVLANGTLFGVLLLCYLASGLCAVAAREGLARSRHAPSSPAGEGATGTGLPSAGGRVWLWFALRWTCGVALVAFPLFLLTPRFEGPEWDPLARFGVRRRAVSAARVGFSDEIDLNRTGQLEVDGSTAFTVTVTDRDGRSERALPADQRWRGWVLDRYEEGAWRCDLQWPTSVPLFRPATQPFDPDPDAISLTYRVPAKVGGLFLAEPLQVGPEPGSLPLLNPAELHGTSQLPLFFEVGGTVMYSNFLPRQEYVYTQLVPRRADPTRYPARRLRDAYLMRLVRCRVTDLASWTEQLLTRLVARSSGAERLKPLAEALGRPRERWEGLPPEVWEPVGRLLTEHLTASGEYGYSLASRRQDTRLDPVLDFLTNVKQGACERYASALALMLRSQGIPARVVKGFRGTDYQGGGIYHVRQSNAHAWVEALVPAAGDAPLTFDWLQLDPTPAGETGEPTGSALVRWWLQQQLSGQTLWQDLVVGYSSRQQAGLLEGVSSGRVPQGVAVLLAVLVALPLAYRLLRKRGRARSVGIRRLHERLVGILQRRFGLRARPEQTAREVALLAREALERKPATTALADIPERVVELFYRERYGGHPVAEDEPAVRELSARLDALERASSSP